VLRRAPNYSHPDNSTTPAFHRKHKNLVAINIKMPENKGELLVCESFEETGNYRVNATKS